MKKLAPIVIFTHTRLEKLKKTITALKKNELSIKSYLYIISDGAKNKIEENKIKKVRNYIKKIKGFKKISIVLRKKNYGLSFNIVKGVNSIINKHGKIIVLEDDIKVGKNFLDFLNYCLDKYNKQNKVWHISAWNYNVDLPRSLDAYFIRTMNCWGWATWKNRWKFYKKNPKKIIQNWSKSKIKRFNIDNNFNFFSQIIRNHENKINTWAIFWYAIIFEKKGLCLNPTVSLTENIGVGADSTHTFQVDEILKSKIKVSSKKQFKLPNVFTEDRKMIEKIKKQIKKNNRLKFLRKIKKIIYD